MAPFSATAQHLSSLNDVRCFFVDGLMKKKALLRVFILPKKEVSLSQMLFFYSIFLIFATIYRIQMEGLGWAFITWE